MNNLLPIIAVITFLSWAVAFLIFDAKPIVHMLLVISVISLLLKVISNEENNKSI